MFEFISAVFKIYPATMWISIVGFGLIFFGGKNWSEMGLWLVGGVAVFMLVIKLILEEDEDWKRKRNRRD